MTTWIIEPRDPLIVRDGRPFGPDPGARAKSLPFPFPSTLAGGVRTRAGMKNGVFDDSADTISEVKKINICGPLLVELEEASGEIKSWLAPAPADALLLPVDTDEKQVQCSQLLPIETSHISQTNMADGLSLVGPQTYDARKPFDEPPRFWYWDQFEKWLTTPQPATQFSLKELGHQGPVPEQRVHVRLDPDSMTGVEGYLFLTSGLEFNKPSAPSGTLSATRLALALQTDANIKTGIAPLGGERRLMSWRDAGTVWPQQPHRLKQEIIRTKACRLLLLTPGYFKQGYQPEWIGKQISGVTANLVAVALSHPETVSGWDFEKDTPKPTRRLAPAGTVYFLRLDGSDGDIEQWVDEMWMKCVSDDDKDDLMASGFGLAVLGTWTGQLRKNKEVP